MGLGLPHLGFFTKKGNRETHRFHQWMISSLCFTYSWDRNLGSEKKNLPEMSSIHFYMSNTCNCSSIIQFWGEKPSGVIKLGWKIPEVNVSSCEIHQHAMFDYLPTIEHYPSIIFPLKPLSSSIYRGSSILKRMFFLLSYR